MAGQLEGIFNRWSKVRITDKELVKLVMLAMSPSKEVAQNLREETIYDYSSQFIKTSKEVLNYAYANHTQRLETTKGTLFGAYNAITGYHQNV